MSIKGRNENISLANAAKIIKSQAKTKVLNNLKILWDRSPYKASMLSKVTRRMEINTKPTSG